MYFVWRVMYNVQARRQLNWIGGGGHRSRSGLKVHGAFICYTSALISRKVFAKIVLSNGYAVEKWGPGDLPPEKFLKQRPL